MFVIKFVKVTAPWTKNIKDLNGEGYVFLVIFLRKSCKKENRVIAELEKQLKN